MEVKHGKSPIDPQMRQSLAQCGSASRYGFDFANENVKRDIEQFQKAIDAFKKAKSIIFADEITNERGSNTPKVKREVWI